VALPGRSAAHGHKRDARFQRPGHRVTGDRSSQDRGHQDGVDVVHAIIDDHSRLAYAEIHPDAKAATVLAFLERALRFYAEQGITARRLMTDNAWAYARSRLVRDTLARERIRHLTTKPYRPRTNGKIERFHQTMAREWAYGLVYQSHHDRATALPHWPHHYNTTRPHSSLGGRAPISRAHNVRGQDT
jgi:transposase InsO family protein